MANEEQLTLLKASVKKWNEWREKHSRPSITIDLEGADLRNASLSQANLSKAYLSQADLRKANFSQANFARANLSRANLSRADLSKAKLTGANLSSATLSGTILSGANLSGANLSKVYLRADLSGANLTSADLSGANLTNVTLSGADLRGATLNGANLSGANLRGANLSRANLSRADLRGAYLTSADLSEANLSDADLVGATLSHSNLVRANIEKAKISQSNVYGVNVWDLGGEFKEQKGLVITPPFQPSITVDNIKVAQFVYLILNNREIREVINTLTSKTVLIIGRFAIPERKAILDALRERLREYGLVTIVFDFERPDNKDFTETIKTLSGLCYFVIADITNPKSSPLELQATVPDYQIPFVPIIQEGEKPFAMMVDLQKKYSWVLDTLSYRSIDELIKALKPAIIDPAIQKHNELRLMKAREPKIRSASDFIEDKGMG